MAMNDNHANVFNKKFGWAFLLLTLLFVSCSHGKYPENLTMIPSDASMVLCVDMNQLLKKAAVSSNNETASFDVLSQMASLKVPMLAWWIHHPDQSGIDFHQAIFGFETASHQVGVTFLLHSKSDFRKALQNAIASVRSGSASIVSLPHLEYLFLPEQDSTVIVWDRHKALVLFHSLPKQAAAVFMTKESQSMVANADFVHFYSHCQDVSCWIDPQKMMDGSSAGLSGNATNGKEQSFVHGYLSFHKGVIELKADGVESIVPFSWVNVEANDSLPFLLPASSLLSAHVALHPEAVLKALSERKMAGSTPWESLLQSWSGNAVISLTGFSQGDGALPQVLLLAKLKDKAGFDVVVNELLRAFPHEQKEGFTKVTVQMVPLYAALKGKIMLLTTSLPFVRDFVKGNKNQPTTKIHGLASTVSDPVYFYLNLDFEHYPEGFNDFMQNFPIGGSLDLVKQAFLFKEIVFSYNPKQQQLKVQCHMNDTTQNSLHVIVNKFNDLFISKH